MLKKKKALIFGITGQDGSYLTEFLLKKNILFTESKEDHHHLIQKGLIIFMKKIINLFSSTMAM